MSDEKDLDELLQEVSTILAESTRPQVPPPELKAKILAAIDELENPQEARGWFNWGWAMAAAFLISIGAPGMLQRPPVIGQLFAIQGDVFINNKPAINNDEIRQGQKVTTNTNGSAELHLSDKAVVKIKSNALLSAKSLGGGYEINLTRGGVANWVKTGTPYAVITPALTTEAVGTEFIVKVMDQNRSYVCICHGHIRISKGRFIGDLEAENHKAIFAQMGSNGIEITPGTLIAHSE